MKPTIHLALTHDWELRGDGSGDIEQIQFAPLRQLLDIYAKLGARTTILPDVMQQIAFRRCESKHPNLKSLADSWDEHAREAFRAGHDIQLHLHPQWGTAEYANRRWQLDGDWSILSYDRDAAYTMVAEGKRYLESLLHPLAADYQCIAFRAGGLAAAPSVHLFKSLADLGIQLDVSIAAGVFVNNRNLQLDYRNCEETFLPFYPMMEDARRVSDRREQIVCVPLNHFYGSRRTVGRQNLSLAWREVQRRSSKQPEIESLEKPVHSPSKDSPFRVGLVFEKLIMPAVKRKHFVSDTGRLTYQLMREMLTSVRQRAQTAGLAHVPVVLTNHPKDIRDLPAIERFIEEVSQAEDISFITLSEMAGKLRSGKFQVRTAVSKPPMNTD